MKQEKKHEPERKQISDQERAIVEFGAFIEQVMHSKLLIKV